jgi:hypothetical protein
MDPTTLVLLRLAAVLLVVKLVAELARRPLLVWRGIVLTWRGSRLAWRGVARAFARLSDDRRRRRRPRPAADGNVVPFPKLRT